MDSEQSKPLEDEVKKLREAYLKQGFLKHIRLLAFVEELPDSTFPLELFTEDGTSLGVLNFRRWKHGEVTNMHKLPFYSKIAVGEELTPEESIKFKAAKAEMVSLVVDNKRLWDEVATSHPGVLDEVFAVVSVLSGLSPKFIDELDDFMNEDFGYNYGMLWFYIFHKTPSEIAQLPETDVQTINMWLYKWSERLGRKGT